jgi:AcrR family transcriptional regulator
MHMDDTRQQLMDAAGPLFAERGFRATTVREICEAAEANQAAINYHFGDKENLYVECVRHAGQVCKGRVPLPDWPQGVPARQKLRDFVRMFVNRVVVDYVPVWHSQLIMREMVMPTKACAEFVTEFVEPQFVILQQILAELLLPHVPEKKRLMTGFSIVGQILHYRSARPVLTMLVGDDISRLLDVETLTDHITTFSLAAIDQIATANP